MKSFSAFFLYSFVLITTPVLAEEQSLQVEVDTSEVPYLDNWGSDARDLIERWHPRISNLIASEGFSPTRSIKLVFKKTDQGVAATSGNVITVSSHWVEKHPEDIGLIHHELVHVIQAYPPSAGPWWITEGIADYLRWAIFEGKEQPWFQRPQEKKGYRRGYRIAGGFLLWLESGPAPGIVKKLNTSMRKRKYSDEIFQDETGKTLDELWNEYAGLQ